MLIRQLAQRCSAAPPGSWCDRLLPALHTCRLSGVWQVQITGDLIAFTWSLSINVLQIPSCSIQVVPAELWRLHSFPEELRLVFSKKVLALIPCCVFVCALQKTAKISKKVAALGWTGKVGKLEIRCSEKFVVVTDYRAFVRIYVLPK